VLSVLLPNLLLLVFLPALVVWAIALLDVARAPDLTGDRRIVYALLLIFASPIGVIAWLGLRGQHHLRAIAVGVAVAAMAMLLAITIVEVVIFTHHNGGTVTTSVPSAHAALR
jgi:predicted membrane protein